MVSLRYLGGKTVAASPDYSRLMQSKKVRSGAERQRPLSCDAEGASLGEADRSTNSNQVGICKAVVYVALRLAS